MTDLKYTPLTLAVRDAVVAWLDTDPTMAPLGQGADARALEAAHDRLLPVLAVTQWTSRGVDPNVLADIGDAERLVRPEDKTDSRTHLLALKEIVRAHPDTNAARLLAYHEAAALLGAGEPGSVAASGFDLVDALHTLALASPVWSAKQQPSVLRQSYDDLQRRLLERDVVIAGLRDHLSRETKSAEAASAIADELSVALEASRAVVTARDAQIRSLQAQLVRECEAHEVRAFKTLRDDNDCIAVATVEGYEKQILALRGQLQTAHRDAEDLRDRMADPEGMSMAARESETRFP